MVRVLTFCLSLAFKHLKHLTAFNKTLYDHYDVQVG
jgi:hypothetical protein